MSSVVVFLCPDALASYGLFHWSIYLVYRVPLFRPAAGVPGLFAICANLCELGRAVVVPCLAALEPHGIPLVAAFGFFIAVSVRKSENANWCLPTSQLLAGSRIQVGVTVPAVVVMVHGMPNVAHHI